MSYYIKISAWLLVFLLALLIGSPLSSATLCRDMEITADSYAMNNTYAKVNATSLTLSSIAELRVYDKPCLSGGSLVGVNATATDGSTWAEILFPVNEILSSGENVTYSLQYNNGLSTPDPISSLFWGKTHVGLPNNGEPIPNQWASGDVGGFDIIWQHLRTVGTNAVMYDDSVSSVIPTQDYCLLYLYNTSTDSPEASLVGLVDGSAINNDNMLYFTGTVIQVRDGGAYRNFINAAQHPYDDTYVSVKECVAKGHMNYTVWDSSGNQINTTDRAFANSSSIVAAGIFSADAGADIDEFFMTTDTSRILYPSYPSVVMGAEQNLDITNSSWNVTSGNLAAGFTGIEWRTGANLNVTSNVLSFLVSSNVPTNMSCRLDTEGNYSENIAYDSRTKATTTETSSHSITLFENLTDDTVHCVYCDFVSADGRMSSGGSSLSGCLSVGLDLPTVFAGTNVSLLTPVNGSQIESTSVKVTYNLSTNGTDCLVILNSSVVQTMTGLSSGIQESGTFAVFNGSNYVWTVNCSDSESAGSFNFSVLDTSFGGTLSYKECPTDLDGWIGRIFLFVLVFGFIVLGFWTGIPIIGIIGSLLLLFLSLFIAYCNPIVAIGSVFVGLSLFVAFMVNVKDGM